MRSLSPPGVSASAPARAFLPSIRCRSAPPGSAFLQRGHQKSSPDDRPALHDLMEIPCSLRTDLGIIPLLQSTGGTGAQGDQVFVRIAQRAFTGSLP
jgi:hypothetical protein